MSDKHYMGNPLLKRANVSSEFNQYQLFELAKCAVDPVYFAKNYIKIVNVDDGLVSFDMWPFQEKMLRTFHENRFSICKLPRQPLDNDTPIPTPNGYKKIVDLKINDLVYDLSGKPTKVISKVSYKNKEKCYKLTFRGKQFQEHIICDKDHLWNVYIDGKNLVLTAEELKKENRLIKVKRNSFSTLIDNWDEDIILSNIIEVKSRPVSCIEVENRDHTFLCGSNYIPTHNCGKTTTTVSFLLHYAIFNENVSIAILANKASSAKDILSRLQISFENLPEWMQPGVKSWNKTSLELDNNSKIITASTSASSVRGGSYNVIFLDEFAFVPNNVALNFMNSVYPTISSGKESKVIVCSCVTKDTYLLTNKGYRKIETLIDFTKKLGYYATEYTVRGKNKFYSSNILFNNGKSTTNIIKTKYEEIECSETHKLWAFKDGKYSYVESKDLTVGDYISLKYNQQVFGNDDYVGFNPEKDKSTNCFSCEYITEEIAYFIGLYVAEGYAREKISKNTDTTTRGQIIISCGDDISESLNKLNVRYYATDKVHYTINSKHLVEFLKHLGFNINNKSTKKILPDSVLSWSKKNIVSLLKGMFDGDGCITKKGVVSYSSTSRELIRQVQLLLANLGIVGSIYKSISPSTELVKVYSTHYTIEISGRFAVNYFNIIGFGLKRKQERICYLRPPKRIGNNSDIIPNSSIIIKENKNEEICRMNLNSDRSKNFKNHSREFLLSKKEEIYNFSNDILKEFLDDNVQDDMIWVKIKDITKSENEVFDVSLPDIKGDKWAHSVLYNNFVGHQTPCGLNYFYKMWDDAIKKLNDYKPLEINWNDVPGRDDEWREKTIANLGGGQIGQKAFDQEFSCSFLGSSDTLISGAKLQTMVANKPIKSKKGLDVYVEPKPEHQYMITADVSRGVDLDYSAFAVIDITKMPYQLVAKYRDNSIKPIMFPYIIKDVGLHYNKAFVLCETNDVGDQVATALHYDLDYPNLLTCSIKGRQGQVLGQGFGGNRVEYGVKMSGNVKKIGGLNLKMLIEEDKLLVNDYDTINELSTFVQKSNTFKAEEGKNDDLAICLLIFAWASTNEYFKEITDEDVRKKLFEEKSENEESDILPLGYVPGADSNDTIVEDNLVWNVVPPEQLISLWSYNY